MASEGRQPTGNRRSSQPDENQSSAASVDSCDSERNGGLAAHGLEHRPGHSCKSGRKRSKSQGRSLMSFSKSTVASRNKLITRSSSTHSEHGLMSGNFNLLQRKSAVNGSDALTSEDRRVLRRKRQARSVESHRDTENWSREMQKLQSTNVQSRDKAEHDRDRDNVSPRKGSVCLQEDGNSGGKRRNTQTPNPTHPKTELLEKEKRTVAYTEPSSRRIKRAFDRVGRRSADLEGGKIDARQHRDVEQQPKELNNPSESLQRSPHNKSKSLHSQAPAREKSYSEYSTTPTDISRDNTSPTLPSVQSLNLEASGYSSSQNCFDTRDSKSSLYEVQRVPERICLVKRNGVIKNEEKTREYMAESKTGSFFEQKPSKSDQGGKKRLIASDGKYHGPCCRFKRSHDDGKLSKGYQRRQSKSDRNVPYNLENNVCSSETNDPNAKAEHLWKTTSTGSGSKKSRVARDNGRGSCEDFNSQLQSVIEYQALLSENIRYLSYQLDQVVSHLAQGSATGTPGEPEASRRYHQADCRGRKPSHPGICSKEDAASSRESVNHRCAYPRSPSRAHKSQQTESKFVEGKSSSSSQKLNSSSTDDGRSVKARVRDSKSPSYTKRTGTSMVESTSQNSSLSQTCPHPCPGFVRQASPINRLRRASSSSPKNGMFSKPRGQEVSVSPSEVTKLLQEMEMWRKKLTITAVAVDRSFPPHDGPAMEGPPGQTSETPQQPGSTPGRDKNWSSCVHTHSSRSSDLSVCSPGEEGDTKSSGQSGKDPGDGRDKVDTKRGRPQCTAPDKTSGLKVTVAQLLLLLVTVLFQLVVQMVVTYHRAR